MTQCSDDLDNTVAEERYLAARDARRPFVILRPRIFIDGDQWCALYGEKISRPRAALADRDGLERRSNRDLNDFVHNRENEELEFREWALRRIDWFRAVLTEEAAKVEYLYPALEAMQELEGPSGELQWPRWEDLKSIKKEDCRAAARRTVYELEKKRYEDEKARAALCGESSDLVAVPSDTLDWIFRSLCAYLDYFGVDSRCYDPKEAAEAIRPYTSIGNPSETPISSRRPRR